MLRHQKTPEERQRAAKRATIRAIVYLVVAAALLYLILNPSLISRMRSILQ
ncbi:MAG: hypothetical protein OXT69_03735 [Candidatus Poribacteria bacterium]|nr:hypothetical protein [Candidatus Poribacteria bacterium]